MSTEVKERRTNQVGNLNLEQGRMDTTRKGKRWSIGVKEATRMPQTISFRRLRKSQLHFSRIRKQAIQMNRDQSRIKTTQSLTKLSQMLQIIILGRHLTTRRTKPSKRRTESHQLKMPTSLPFLSLRSQSLSSCSGATPMAPTIPTKTCSRTKPKTQAKTILKKSGRRLRVPGGEIRR